MKEAQKRDFGRQFRMRGVHLLAAIVLSSAISGGPALAGDDSGFFGAWIECANGKRLVAVQLNAKGEPLGEPFARELPPAAAAMSVASGGATRVLLFDDGANVYALRFDGRAIPLDEEPLLLGRGRCGCAAGWDGSRFLLVWAAPNDEHALATAFLAPSGAPSLADRIPTTTASLLAIPRTVTWKDDAFRVYWSSTQFPPHPPHVTTTYWNYTPISSAGTAGGTRTPIPEDGAPHAFAQHGTEALSLVATFGVAVYRFEHAPPSHRFRWISPVNTIDLATDAAGFIAAWAYEHGSVSRVALARLDEGSALVSLDAAAAPPIAELQVAVDGTDAPLILARTKDKQLLALGRDDFSPAPAPPSPPVLLDASGAAGRFELVWQDTSDNEAGFFAADAELPADTTHATVATSRADSFQVTAWNDGGSASSATLAPHLPLRRRAQ